MLQILNSRIVICFNWQCLSRSSNGVLRKLASFNHCLMFAPPPEIFVRHITWRLLHGVADCGVRVTILRVTILIGPRKRNYYKLWRGKLLGVCAGVVFECKVKKV
ncbi:uncharacterized protein LOC130733674 [Lotus japonicus]|uniref:uncharacterized protein LOC130733674 n=1 Tax=Lotus japonicus TaxID=34305 RepID=UPI00258B9319|nr:uncharacterized protein LOC130733674 [Lotus japonicus]